MNVEVYRAVTGDHLVDVSVRGRHFMLTVVEAQALAHALNRSAAEAKQLQREWNERKGKQS